MEQLSDTSLIKCYENAIKMELDPAFLTILEKEMNKRGLNYYAINVVTCCMKTEKQSF
ncbi:sporulation histidine kinase inhibitor Sda [Evansella sp. AB-rgal1]|uniref:sporulation histidine kinase inhibitor Sda n=1 Tax=Evansella sp. AB-rgal1 TaxID=3242696 RepID=UPI00359D38C2